MADLETFEVFRDLDMHGSSFVVAWFQQEYAFPIEDSILEKMKSIPWSQIATEYQN